MKKNYRRKNEALTLQRNSFLTSYTPKEKYVPSPKTTKSLEKTYQKKVKEKK
jgi:hypothetical protein